MPGSGARVESIESAKKLGFIGFGFRATHIQSYSRRNLYARLYPHNVISLAVHLATNTPPQ
jgi:hypothetical protein